MTWTDGSACSSGAKMETSPSKNIVGVVCSLVPDTIGLLVFADRTIPRPQHSRDHSRQWALSLFSNKQHLSSIDCPRNKTKHMCAVLCTICVVLSTNERFLPRCMECRRGLAMRNLSVCPSASLSVCLSVCLSNV